MMRKIIVMVIMLIACMGIYSQRNWIGLTPVVSTTWQLDDSPLTQSKTGAAVGLGVNYQLQKGHFILEMGAEATYNYHCVGLEDTELAFRMIDTRGMEFTYHGLVHDRLDQSHNMSLRIPVMVGAEYGHVYFLAGAKVHVNMKGSNVSTAKLTTWGEYDKFFDNVVDVPTHGFQNAQGMKSSTDFIYGVDLRPSVEVGGVVYIKEGKCKLHVGIFAEYGVINTLPSDRVNPLVIPDLSEYMKVEMTHIYDTPNVEKLNHLAAGVRVKAYILAKDQYKCRCIWD